MSILSRVHRHQRRLRLLSAIALALPAVLGNPAAAVEPGGLHPTTVQQITALWQEKLSRTAVQQKLDSHLVLAIRYDRGETLGGGVPRQRSNLTLDAQGRVHVDIRAEVTPALLAEINRTGVVENSHPRYRAVRAWMPLGSLEPLAARNDVAFIETAVPAITRGIGRLTSEGDVTHRAGAARTNFNVMGEGVKIGVLSDSVNTLGSLDRALTSGDVPAVTVLPGQSGVGQDEGTAMLEIVADLAPKAELYYATAFGGPANFAQNIVDLRLAGCDVIVDDVGYANESPFQDDNLAQSVNIVTANGAMYFSSAGNSGNKNDNTAAAWEGDFRNGPSVTLSNRMGVAHTYGGNTNNNRVTASGGFVLTTLHWADPLLGATNDYDLFVVDSNNNVVASSTMVQNGNDDPYENLSAGNGDFVVILLVSGERRFLHLELFGAGDNLLEYSTEGIIKGHNATTNGFGVAAVDVATSFPNPYIGGAANPVEKFSSDGPRRVFFDPMGNALTPGSFTATGGVVRLQPEIAAADGVMTTVTPRGGGFNPFFGTSAAAPHAAAIAALLKSYNPGLTPAQIRFALTNTALDIEGPGFDRDSGWGIVSPFPALASVPAPLPTLIASNLTGGNFNGVVDVNECNELELTLKNNAISTATSVSASLVTGTPGVSVVIGTAQYPNMAAGGTAANTTPFRFYTDPGFICGTPIDFSLRISSSLGNVTNNFRLLSGRVGTLGAVFTNTTPAAIPDNNTNGVDVFIPVNGILGSVGKITVGVHITHPSAGDLRLDLYSPDGTRVVLSAFRGASNANFGLDCQQTTVFDDAAPTNITGSAFPPFVGSFAPQQPLSSFGGKFGAGANGQWRLNVRDFVPGVTGTVECVTITIFPALCTDGGGDCTADLGVSIADSPDPVLVGSNLTYTLTVTNHSPRLAPVTTLLDTLPPGVTILSVNSTRGSCSASASSVNCALGTLPGNGSAIVRLVVRGSVAGLITNQASVTSLAMDTNPADNTDVEVTSVENPRPIIAPFVTSLLSESGPVTGGLEPGETVTISFGFRNIGTLDTTNLVAKLLTGGGVTSPSDPQTYGVLVANGLSVARPFSFTALGTNNGIVVATFQLQEGTNNLGSVSFSFALGGGAGYANRSVINIPDSGPAALYPSPVFVSGLVGSVARVSVTLSNLTHSFPEDLDILLVSPSGQKVLLLSDAGASLAINNVTLMFDDAASGLVPSGSAIVSGPYRPTDYPPADDFGGNPPGPYASTLAAFNGTNPNGTWGLYLFDDVPGDSGRLAGGWSLDITTFDPINPNAELGVTAVDAPDPVKVGSNVTYTVTVANAGPEAALGVVLTNLLPSGVAFVSADSTQGVCSNDAGTVFCEIGTLPVGGGAVVTVVGTATGLGVQTFTARVSGGVADFTPANDIATITTFIEANADLVVGLSSLPKTASVNGTLQYYIGVTNLGPNPASGVVVTNLLPAGVAFVSAVPSQGAGCTESGGVVICDLGSIDLGASATAVITVTTPANVAPLTNTAIVAAGSPPDPDAANNQAELVVNNLNPSFVIVAAMTFLVSESGPITGGMEPGETVAINFLLRNEGQESTTNLVATLLSLGGVTAPGGPQDYGAILPGGAAVGRTNTFTVSPAPGPVLTATLSLQDGPFDLGTVSFNFPVGGTTRFTQATPVLIPAFGRAQPYPSTLDVSGLTGVVGKVTLTLAGLSHSYPDDLDILVTSPTGRVVMALSDAGGGQAVTDITLTLDDDAADSAPDSGPLVAGSYRPTDFEADDVLESPAPAGPYSTVLSTFQGIDPNGTWSLYLYDDFFQDQGVLAGGWSLDITTVGIIDPQPALLFGGRFLPAGGFEFTLQGIVGGKYEIQTSTNFRDWSRVTDTILSRSNTVRFMDPAPAGAPRFYRAVHQP